MYVDEEEEKGGRRKKKKKKKKKNALEKEIEQDMNATSFSHSVILARERNDRRVSQSAKKKSKKAKKGRNSEPFNSVNSN